MKKLFKISLSIALPLLLLTTMDSCKKDSTPAPPIVVVTKQVKITNSKTLGNYLTDKDGRALYVFSNDYLGVNSCPGGCEAVWPYFNVDTLTAEKLGDTSLHIADFTNVVAANGKKQIAYKGWPLYYYAPAVGGVNTPEVTGVTTGEGVGGIWFVAKTDYTIMLVNQQLVGNDGKTYKSDYTEGTGKTLFFSDGLGHTLYSFKNDRLNTNKFTKSDLSNNTVWPVYENTKVVVPSTLDASLFGSIDVFTKKQVTYKGWPLYYFAADSLVRGKTKGVSMGPTPGTWSVPFKDIAAPLAP
jgi:predicted lipoprotein with Yx(FWY)xxD motif